MFKVVSVCDNEIVAAEITSILQEADTTVVPAKIGKDTWEHLESKHIQLWQKEKETYIINVRNTANYKLESISSNYRNRKRTLEQKIRDNFDERIRRMYMSELNTATENYQNKVSEINDRTSRADIHTSLVANGMIEIRKG